ncbi:unnamed protein product [Chrysoparadoxa australica]
MEDVSSFTQLPAARPIRSLSTGLGMGKGFAPRRAPPASFNRTPPNAEGTPCVCGSNESYAACCKAYHEGKDAEDVIKLLRSRYSAYAYRLPEYIISTTDPSCEAYKAKTKDERNVWVEELLNFSDNYEFDGLDVGTPEAGTQGDGEAYLNFTAKLRMLSDRVDFEERSRFVRVGSQWLYAGGDVDYEPEVKKTRRTA